MKRQDSQIMSLEEAREVGLDRRQYMGIVSALGASMIAGCAGDDPENGTGVNGDDDGADDDTDDVDEEDRYGGTLDVATRGPLETLDLHVAGLGTTWSVIGDNIIQKCFKMTPGADVEPNLATGLEILDDGRQLVMSVREGVQWHPPYQRELVAEDIVTNWLRVLPHDSVTIHGDLQFPYPDATGGRQPNLDFIDEIDITGDHEIVLHLDEVEAFADYSLADRGGSIYSPENLEEGNQGNHPVGTGPFVFDEWVPRDVLTMTRFDDYWGEGPYVDRVNHRPIADDTVKVQELEQENIDLINQPPPEHIERLEGNDNTLVTWAPVFLERNTLNFNATDHVEENRSEHMPTMSHDVRKALREAIDPEEYLALVAGGHGQTNATLYPGDHPWGVEYEPFDEGRNPEAAEQLLDEAGFDTPVEVTVLSSSDDRVNRQMGQIVVEQIRPAGFEPELMEIEDAQFQSQLSNYEYDILTGQGNIGPTPSTMLGDRIFQKSEDPETDPRPYHGGPNHHEYDNNAEEVINLMNEAAQIIDPEPRLETFQEAWRKLADDCFLNMMTHNAYLRSHGTWVNDYEAYPDVFHNAYEKLWFDPDYRD